MSELDGTPPPAKDRSRSAGRDKVLRPFDHEEEQGERWRARHRFSTVVWPFLIGLMLGIFAPKLRGVLDDLNPWVSRLVFPFVLLVERPEFGLRWYFGGYLSQIVLFLQFPVEGLWVTLNLRLRGRLSFAFAPLIFLHMVGAFILFLLIQARS
ncbi:MAG: hypothetical protein WBE38_00945 [Terracidiphilus sp.]|jgi:hypothetical protein